MIVTLFAHDPPPINEDYTLRIDGPDRGLINAWLAGLEKRKEWPEVIAKVSAGELPPLPFRGGIAEEIQTKKKVGHLWYVAMWHGLRGDDLNLSTGAELVMVCSRTGVSVLFTIDQEKLKRGK